MLQKLLSFLPFSVHKKLARILKSRVDKRLNVVDSLVSNTQLNRAISKAEAADRNSKDFVVVLLGYTSTSNKHTNWYPWAKFQEVFEHLGYESGWFELSELSQIPETKRRIYICWNEPDAMEILESGHYRKGDVILQKLTSFSKYDGQMNWTEDPLQFFKDWDWPLYKMSEQLLAQGVNIYNFGCKTAIEPFPEKHRICSVMQGRQFWIPWGSSLYSWDEIQKASPIMEGFSYDIGFVGSLWGKAGRGNTDSWEEFIQPLLDRYPNHHLAGMGMPNPPVGDPEHKEILRNSKLCPIINAPSWRVERGIQDRFWSVFSSGRFGVVDSEGVLDFFDEKEVVCETDPQEYVSKSLYYLENVEQQAPYIETALKRIKEEYNYYHTWRNIIETIKKEN